MFLLIDIFLMKHVLEITRKSSKSVGILSKALLKDMKGNILFLKRRIFLHVLVLFGKLSSKNVLVVKNL